VFTESVLTKCAIVVYVAVAAPAAVVVAIPQLNSHLGLTAGGAGRALVGHHWRPACQLRATLRATTLA